jgi:hypothetical protein
MRKINDVVSGKPSYRAGLWAMTNKQAFVSASACFSIQARQSLLGFDYLLNKHPGLRTLSTNTCQHITGSSNVCQMLQHMLL